MDSDGAHRCHGSIYELELQWHISIVSKQLKRVCWEMTINTSFIPHRHVALCSPADYHDDRKLVWESLRSFPQNSLHGDCCGMSKHTLCRSFSISLSYVTRLSQRFVIDTSSRLLLHLPLSDCLQIFF